MESTSGDACACEAQRRELLSLLESVAEILARTGMTSERDRGALMDLEKWVRRLRRPPLPR